MLSYPGHFVRRIVREIARSRAAYRWLAHIFLLLGSAVACSVSWWGSGIYSPSLLWLGVLPNAAIFFLSQTATMVWLLVVMLVLMVLTIVGYESLKETPQVMLGMSGIGMAVNLVLAQICLMLIHWVYDWQYRQKSSHIGASIKKMKAMQQKLQVTETYKDRFIATVSEDLRSPMNAILGCSDVLAAMAANKPALSNKVEHIRTSIQQLLDMTNNILDHAQLNTGQLQLNYRPMSITRVIQNEWALWSVNADVDFKIVVQKNIPDWLWCDEERFKQIVSILLSNAKKFTSQGQVLLQFNHQNDVLQIDIRDTGVGITEEVKAYIFKRFDKGDEALKHQFGGIGLGLANALELTHLFGGTIGFESKNTQGSHFWMRLPVRKMDGQQVPQKTALEPVDAGPCNLLLVDDEVVGLLVLTHAIQKAWPQAKIVQTSSAEQALKQIEENEFDAVLMNAAIGYLEGSNWGMKLKQAMQDKKPQSCVIGVTANTHEQIKEQLHRAGMDEVVFKPLDHVQLGQTLRHVLKKNFAHQSTILH